ncbi:Hypothetical protein, putative [Bodo saltans]|uniref:Uncharacterized protein n=1 Tax=Bodo saltans TaxID=75058 RepID=A0A0S4IX04_BODSA|nr:Hypothetical protein, putative [Bodo saltans]|eukprot:CUG34936.1 Hypothetical protein, putative [Bodo saltans]
MGQLAAGLSSKGSSPGRNDFGHDDLPLYRPAHHRSSNDALHVDHGSPKDPLGGTQAQRSQYYDHYEERTSNAEHNAQQLRYHNHLPHGASDDATAFEKYDEDRPGVAFGGSHEPSSIEQSRVVASRDVTDISAGGHSSGRVFSDGDEEETSIERTYRQAVVSRSVIHSSTAENSTERKRTLTTTKTSSTSTSMKYDSHIENEGASKVLVKATPEVSPTRQYQNVGCDASTMVMLSPASPASTQTDAQPHVKHSDAGNQTTAVIAEKNNATSTVQGLADGSEQRQLFAPLHSIPEIVPHVEVARHDDDDDDFEALAQNIATMGDLLEQEGSKGFHAQQFHKSKQTSSATSTATPGGGASASTPRVEDSREGAISTTASASQRQGSGMRLESPQFDFDIPEMDDFMSRSQSAARGHATQQSSRGGDGNSSKGGNGWWSSKSSVVSSKHYERHDDIPSENGDADLHLHEGEIVKSVVAGTTKRSSPSPRQPSRASSSKGAEPLMGTPNSTSAVVPQFTIPTAASMSSYPMIVEKLTFERDSLIAQVKRLERELSQCQSSNEELREALTERQDHARRLASKLEDLSNHRQLVTDELVTSHTVQQRFFKEQLDEAVARHETSTRSMQQTIITLSREKMKLEEDLVQLREDVMNQSRQTVACETLQAHINVLHAQVESLKHQHEAEREQAVSDARQWKRKAEGLLQELSACRASQHEHEVAVELRKVEETMKVELLIEHKVRDAIQHQAVTLDSERRARLASEHEAFQLRLQVQALTSRLAFFEEQVAPEVDLSIKELEEQMQKMHDHRTRFQRTLQSTLTRSGASSTVASPARGSEVTDATSSHELLPRAS